eukprot:2486045-Rhodomonas_salina.1
MLVPGWYCKVVSRGSGPIRARVSAERPRPLRSELLFRRSGHVPSRQLHFQPLLAPPQHR